MDEIDGLWDYGRPAVSEQRFRDRRVTASDPALRLELSTQIARALGLQRRYEEAHATLDDVERTLNPADARSPRPRIRCLLERGRVWNSSGDPLRARPLFVEAWEMARAVQQDALAVDAAHMIAIASPGEERMAWNLRALELAEQSSDPGATRWRASLLNNIGWVLFDAGDHARALEHFERAVEARRGMGRPRELRIARWSVARTHRALGDVEAALETLHALADELKRDGEEDGYVDEEIAECLLAQGHGERSKTHFARAYALLRDDADLAAHQPDRLARLRSLS